MKAKYRIQRITHSAHPSRIGLWVVIHANNRGRFVAECDTRDEAELTIERLTRKASTATPQKPKRHYMSAKERKTA